MHEEDKLFHQLVFGGVHRLEEGRSYLVKERKPGKAWTYFTGALDDGFEGLYITRQHPNHVEKRHGPKTLRVVWLSTTLGRDYLDPHNLGALTNLIHTFSEGPRRSIVLLDGLEFLMINNDYARVLKFMETLHEIVMQRRSVLIVSVDDRAFDPKEMAFLERSTLVLE
ncbi:MAG TPA: DUF835 domain-containing protein [Thermoplasmata archaeon]|nr:DUF835 domain-containing protein [Thermoplasmata archaeon]